MKIAELLSGGLNITLAAVTIILFLNRFVGYRLKIKKAGLVIAGTVCSVVYLLPFIYASMYDLATDFTDLCATAYFILVPYLTLERQKRFTFLGIGIVAYSIAEFLTFIICYMAYPNSLLFKNIVYCSIYLICIIFTTIAIRRKNHRQLVDFFEQLPPIVCIVIFLSCWAAFYGVSLSLDPTFDKDTSNKLMLISAITVVICIAYVVFKYLLASQNKKEAEKQLDMQLSHYNELIERNRDIRRFRHDYKNNLFSLSILLDNGRIDEAKEYISELFEKLNNSGNKFSTGNHLADAIISEKSAAASKRDITIEIDGSIPENGITNYDLCTLLSNALDNAIEGCSGVAPYSVKIRAVEDANAFALKIENPVAQRIEIKNNSVKTSKSDKQNHGIGIGNIKNVVKKYNGFVELKCDDKAFTLEAMMKLRKDVQSE